MKDKIIYIILGVLIVYIAIDILKPSKDHGYEYEQRLYNEQQEEIKHLYKEVQKGKEDIYRFKLLYYAKDSTILNANKRELRELTTNFGRYDLRRN